MVRSLIMDENDLLGPLENISIDVTQEMLITVQRTPSLPIT